MFAHDTQGPGFRSYRLTQIRDEIALGVVVYTLTSALRRQRQEEL